MELNEVRGLSKLLFLIYKHCLMFISLIQSPLHSLFFLLQVVINNNGNTDY